MWVGLWFLTMQHVYACAVTCLPIYWFSIWHRNQYRTTAGNFFSVRGWWLMWPNQMDTLAYLKGVENMLTNITELIQAPPQRLCSWNSPWNRKKTYLWRKQRPQTVTTKTFTDSGGCHDQGCQSYQRNQEGDAVQSPQIWNMQAAIYNIGLFPLAH